MIYRQSRVTADLPQRGEDLCEVVKGTAAWLVKRRLAQRIVDHRDQGDRAIEFLVSARLDCTCADQVAAVLVSRNVGFHESDQLGLIRGPAPRSKGVKSM